MIKKVLIGEISSYKAIIIAEFLYKNYSDLIIISYDYKHFTKYLFTKYSKKNFVLTSPNLNLQKHKKELINLIIQEKIDLFFPVDSKHYGFYIKNKQDFNNTLQYLGDYNIYDNLHDKEKLWYLANKLNIRLPKKFDIQNIEFPIVLKPINLSSAKGVRYFKSYDEFKNVELNKNFIIQEYIKGIGVGYSVFAVDGEIKTGYGHKRLLEYPISGGSSTYRDMFYLPEMKTVAQKILKVTNWSGFAMFEFKLTDSGELILIEVNPRVWGSIKQGLSNGTNYFETLLGPSSNLIKHKNIFTFLSPLIYMCFIQHILRLNFKPLLIFLKNFSANNADVSLLKDFKGFLSIILRKFL